MSIYFFFEFFASQVLINLQPFLTAGIGTSVLAKQRAYRVCPFISFGANRAVRPPLGERDFSNTFVLPLPQSLCLVVLADQQDTELTQNQRNYRRSR